MADAMVDNLSVMFESVDVYGLQSVLDADWAIESVRNYSARHHMRQGVKTAGGLYLETKGYGDEKKLRADFNPANAEAQTYRDWQAVRGHTRFPRITGIHVALDYEADIREYTYFCARKSQQMFLGQGGELESHYFGKSASRHQLYFYDKGLEQDESRGEWLRCEVRYKPQGEEVLPADLFYGLYAVRKQHDIEGLTVGQKCKLYVFHHCPTWKSLFTSSEQKRLLEMAVDKSELLEPIPARLYKDELPRLREDVAFWAGVEALAV